MVCSRALPLLFVLAAACSAPRSPPRVGSSASARSLPKREKLPYAARELLTRRMDRHGDRMILLLESVILLNYDAAEILADELVAEPMLGRPAPGERDTLNALLPPAFFDYQDQLKQRARTLRDAARARADGELMQAFTGVAETCVGCHAAYLYEDDERAEPAQAPEREPI